MLRLSSVELHLSEDGARLSNREEQVEVKEAERKRES